MKKFKLYFYLSLSSFFISGCSLLLVPLADFSSKGFIKILAYFISVVVWLGVVSGIVFFAKANSQCRKMEKQFANDNQKTVEVPRCGALMFFQNKKALISDIMLIVFVITLVLISVIKPDAVVWGTVLIVLLYIAVVCHCFFNGKNYRYILEYKKYLKIKNKQIEEK